MRKYFYIIGLCLLTTVAFGQKRIARNGFSSFVSKTPIETFTARNNQVASILLTDKNKVAFNVIMKSYKFDKALMEEHFNEKYVESEKFPTAKYKGEIISKHVRFNKVGTYSDVKINGKMIFHGVTNPLNVIATITVNENKTITLDSNFRINLEEYSIKVPKVVKEKISKNVKVKVNVTYK